MDSFAYESVPEHVDVCMRLIISCYNVYNYLQKIGKMISIIHNNVVRAEQEVYFEISYQVET